MSLSSSTFPLFSNCCGIERAPAKIVLPSHFHRFQIVPVSCERSLRILESNEISSNY